jgi:membrane-bound lytic murein transglycosylase MltF
MHLIRFGILLLLTGILVAGCGDSAPDPEAQTPGPAAGTPQGEQPGEKAGDDPWLEVAPLPETNIFGDSWTGDYDALVERRMIRVLTVYSTGRYYIDEGSEKGLTFELLKRFEKFVNAKRVGGHLKTHVIFIPVARNQLIPSLLQGRGDIIAAGMTITPERQQLVDFTIPVSKPVREILVTGPSAPDIASVEDLAGQTLYVRHSSSYRESIEELSARLEAKGLEPIGIEEVSESLEDDDLIEMVSGGLLPWAIVDHYKTQMWGDVLPGLTVRDDIVFKSGTRLAWAMRKESPRLMGLANEFLEQNREGTLIGNVLKNRYIRDFDWAENALSRQHYSRFKELEEIFNKYGEEYGFDYLMIAAQGYQESRLDQSKRSAAGAIGVMQILPSTARDPNVGISNIREVDANIHAGIRYLDFLRDRYFSDAEIDHFNRTLLALAAYNAGPSRMINLRSKAEKLGYDPNVWFDNVELVAARDIGRETVQYVANIFKYYIAYRLTLEQGLQREAARQRLGISAG